MEQLRFLLKETSLARAQYSPARGLCPDRKGAWRMQALQQREERRLEKALEDREMRHQGTLESSRRIFQSRLCLYYECCHLCGQTYESRIHPAARQILLGLPNTKTEHGQEFPFLYNTE